MNHAMVTSLVMVTSSFWPTEKPKLTAWSASSSELIQSVICGVGGRRGVILDVQVSPLMG